MPNSCNAVTARVISCLSKWMRFAASSKQDGAEDLKLTRRLWMAGKEDLSPEQEALVAAPHRKRV